MLRGWEVSTADVQGGNFRTAESGGWFLYTLPETYVAGDEIIMHAVGGLRPDEPGNPFPEVVAAAVGAHMLLADGEAGIPGVAPYSDSGFSWRPGTEWTTWTGLGSGNWTAEGEGDEQTVTMAPNRVNEVYTLIDGSGGTPNLPGEGCLVNGSGGMQPYGFAPSLSSDLAFLTISPAPGQAVGIALRMQAIPSDEDHPDAACFMYLTSLVMEASGVFTPIDLATVMVGFGEAGSDGLTWSEPPPLNVFYGQPWNPYRVIESVRPPQTYASSPDFGFQDVWLVDAVSDVSVAFEGVGSLAITVRSFECQTDSETTWECATPEADAWACATPDDTDWTCADDEPGVGYGVLIDVDDDFITYINGGRIKLI